MLAVGDPLLGRSLPGSVPGAVAARAPTLRAVAVGDLLEPSLPWLSPRVALTARAPLPGACRRVSSATGGWLPLVPCRGGRLLPISAARAIAAGLCRWCGRRPIFAAGLCHGGLAVGLQRQGCSRCLTPPQERFLLWLSLWMTFAAGAPLLGGLSPPQAPPEGPPLPWGRLLPDLRCRCVRHPGSAAGLAAVRLRCPTLV